MELAPYPLVNVAPAVADVLSNPEPGRTLACVSPGVQSGDGHCQVLGELPGGEKTIERIHDRIVRTDPVIGVFSECHKAGHDGLCSPAKTPGVVGQLEGS